ncbi:unnamed protein product [Effrenium voratum]|nr:unnamed protein product [Effrenium voratum]
MPTTSGDHVLDLRNLRANLAVGLAQVQDDSVPRILLAPNFQELLAGGGLLDQTFPREQVSRVVAHPAVNTSSLESVGEMLLAIGPEAGWEESELEMFWAAGFAAASLGPRILRSDVAAVAVLALADQLQGEAKRRKRAIRQVRLRRRPNLHLRGVAFDGQARDRQRIEPPEIWQRFDLAGLLGPAPQGLRASRCTRCSSTEIGIYVLATQVGHIHLEAAGGEGVDAAVYKAALQDVRRLLQESLPAEAVLAGVTWAKACPQPSGRMAEVAIVGTNSALEPRSTVPADAVFSFILSEN